MIVAELIELLKAEDQEAEVITAPDRNGLAAWKVRGVAAETVTYEDQVPGEPDSAAYVRVLTGRMAE
jgi:hypothetical protein